LVSVVSYTSLRVASNCVWFLKRGKFAGRVARMVRVGKTGMHTREITGKKV